MPRLLLGLMAVAVCLTGCGTATRPIIFPAARVGSDAIPRSEVQQYLAYVGRFYASVTGNHTIASDCTRQPVAATCKLSSQQVLLRLIEERVVMDFARKHRIRLTSADTAQVDQFMGRILRSTPSLTKTGISRPFLRSVLERQILTQKVEDAVTPGGTKHGFQLHVFRIYFPRSGPNEKQAYQSAITLATEGGSVPLSAVARTEWIRPEKLRPGARAALEAAGLGQYVGPFKDKHYYLVIQLLGRGLHAYGQPLRSKLQLTYFQKWLQGAIRKAKPVCYDPKGKTQRCPGQA